MTELVHKEFNIKHYLDQFKDIWIKGVPAPSLNTPLIQAFQWQSWDETFQQSVQIIRINVYVEPLILQVISFLSFTSSVKCFGKYNG